MGCDKHAVRDEDPAGAASVTALSQDQREVGEAEFSRFSDGHKRDGAGQMGFGNESPREPMPLNDTQRCQQGGSGFEHETPAAPAEVSPHLISESFRGEDMGRGCHGRKEAPPSEDAPSDFSRKDESSGGHGSEKSSAAVVLDVKDGGYRSHGSDGISAASSSKGLHQIEAESRAADVTAASPEASHQASADDDDDDSVKNVREKFDSLMPAEEGAPPEEDEDKRDHVTEKWGQTQELPGEPKAIGTDLIDGEEPEAVEGEMISARNEEGRGSADTPPPKIKESRAAVVGNGTPDDASADALSFVKDDDVSGSDDEFSKGVAKLVGEQQHRQHQHRRQSRQSCERGWGEQSSGRGEDNDENRLGEPVQLFSHEGVRISTLWVAVFRAATPRFKTLNACSKERKPNGRLLELSKGENMANVQPRRYSRVPRTGVACGGRREV